MDNKKNKISHFGLIGFSIPFISFVISGIADSFSSNMFSLIFNAIIFLSILGIVFLSLYLSSISFKKEKPWRYLIFGVIGIILNILMGFIALLSLAMKDVWNGIL